MKVKNVEIPLAAGSMAGLGKLVVGGRKQFCHITA